MQVAYIVEFDIRPAGGADQCFDAALQRVATWLSYTAGRGMDSSSLRATGEAALRPNDSGLPRTASWQVVGAGDVKAIRLEIRDINHRTGGVFLTRLTLGQMDSSTTVRVSMARESSPTWLSPSPPADLRQPGVIRSLLDDQRIELLIAGQLQDGRYLQIRTDAEVSVLIDVLQESQRLPVLLIHTRTLAAMAAARSAASKLVGLVRVVTLDYRALRTLEARLPQYAPPLAGATLVWSDPAAATVSFEASEVNSADEDLLRAHLMRLLAPVSVLARGRDRAYRVARRAEIARDGDDARTKANAALANGDLSGQVEALQAELAASQAALNEWQELAVAEEQRSDRFRLEAERVPALEAQIEQLLIAVRALPASEARVESDPWSNIPELVTSDTTSAQSLFLYLQDVTSGHLAFSERAATSWRRSRYPFPGEMAECLVKLARVSMTLYDGQDRTFPHLDTWMREEFDLKVSLQDDTIEQDSALRDFDLEGLTYKRTPHVKVRDHAPPSQVGRIHFALDYEGQRIIVDHVGLKLY